MLCQIGRGNGGFERFVPPLSVQSEADVLHIYLAYRISKFYRITGFCVQQCRFLSCVRNNRYSENKLSSTYATVRLMPSMVMEPFQ